MAEFDYEVVNGRKIRVRPVETVSSGMGKAVPLVKPCIHREGASGAGGCHQYQYGRTCAS